MTDRQKRNLKSYCSEQLELIDNYQQAKADDFEGWCIHHRLEIQPDGTRVSAQELKDNGLYYDRPANELVFVRKPEHHRLHWIGNTFNKGKHLSAETRQKIAEARKGENNPFFGKTLSNEHRKKLSESLKGRTFSSETRQKMSVNNGRFWKGKTMSAETRQKMSKSRKGMLWWNNGISSTHSRECPGEGWTRGRLRFK